MPREYIKVVRVVGMVNANTTRRFRVDIEPNEDWYLLKILFRVPYNAFRVALILDGYNALSDTIDDTNDTIELQGSPVKVTRYIEAIVTNMTTENFEFKMALHVKAVRET